MLSDLLEILKKDEWYEGSENIQIAKGKYHLSGSKWSRLIREIKRYIHIRRYRKRNDI